MRLTKLVYALEIGCPPSKLLDVLNEPKSPISRSTSSLAAKLLFI